MHTSTQTPARTHILSRSNIHTHSHTRTLSLSHTLTHTHTHTHQKKTERQTGKEAGQPHPGIASSVALQHAPTTHCKTLQHTLQHTAARTILTLDWYQVWHKSPPPKKARREALQHTATFCNTLQHASTHCNATAETSPTPKEKTHEEHAGCLPKQRPCNIQLQLALHLHLELQAQLQEQEEGEEALQEATGVGGLCRMWQLLRHRKKILERSARLTHAYFLRFSSQCVAGCCRGLQCVAVCCSVL